MLRKAVIWLERDPVAGAKEVAGEMDKLLFARIIAWFSFPPTIGRPWLVGWGA